MTRPLVAIAGRPNVGKSALYNRLVGGRAALVHETPGVTRDRRYGEVEYFGRRVRVVDTGGLDPDAAGEVLSAGIHRQARLAIEEADGIIFVVDVLAGVTALDRDIARFLRTRDRPIFLAGNKVDSVKREALVSEFYSLGFSHVYPISALHGRGVDELVAALVDVLAATGADDREDLGPAPVRIAFVGKPNAGKSSLVNRVLGVERALVHPEPGTTTDPVDTRFEWDGHNYVLIDTAGIRRRARIESASEKISAAMALGQLRRADVAVLVIDAATGPSEQDARLAGAIEESGRAVVIAVTKADLLNGTRAHQRSRDAVGRELHFISYAPVVFVSALRGDGVGDLLTAVRRAAGEHRRRIGTPDLNRFFAEVCASHPPPRQGGRPVRIHYLTQGGVRPPTFLLWANRPDGAAPPYRRFIANQLRGRYGFAGTPLRVLIRRKRGRRAQT